MANITLEVMQMYIWATVAVAKQISLQFKIGSSYYLINLFFLINRLLLRTIYFYCKLIDVLQTFTPENIGPKTEDCEILCVFCRYPWSCSGVLEAMIVVLDPGIVSFSFSPLIKTGHGHHIQGDSRQSF